MPVFNWVFSLSLFPSLTSPLQVYVYACRERVTNSRPHTYFFDHTRTWRASPQRQGLLRRHHKHLLPNTARMRKVIYEGHMVGTRGLLWPKVSQHSFKGEEKPRKKPHPRNCPDRVRCVGSANAIQTPQRWTLLIYSFQRLSMSSGSVND